MRALIDMPVHARSVPILKAIAGLECAWVDKPEEKARALPPVQIKDCQILFCTFPPLNHAEMTQLSYIQICSSGYAQVVAQGFPDRGIRVCNALGVFDVPIAEWNIAMMVNLARDLRGLIRNQEEKVWDRSARFQEEIRGRTVGLWGYGGIARETARLAKALGMNVHALVRNGVQPRKNVYLVPETGDPNACHCDCFFGPNQTKEFLRGLDFLVIAIPQTTATTGMIGEAELRLLRQSCFVLNPARGPIIQEAALLRALREGWIAGAALDTHYYYPMPPGHPFWNMPNVIMTPHIAGSSASPRFLERTYDVFTQNIRRLLEGKPLLNELSPAQLRGG